MLTNTIYQNILEHLDTAVLLLDEAAGVTFANAAAEVLLESSNHQVMTTVIRQLLDAGEDTLSVAVEALESGAACSRREVNLRLLNGHKIIVDYTLTPLASQVLIELQTRKRIVRISREEDQLAQQNAARALVRGLAHEVKNPLGGIRGAAQLLSLELEDHGLQDYTRIIIDEADRLGNLVDKMLGPQSPVKRELINIHEVLERVRQLVKAESQGSILFQRDYDPSIPEFYGLKEPLIQAFLNVVRNAMQAILSASNPARGEIRLQTRCMRYITIGKQFHRLACKVSVIDNGPGIPTHLLNDIFYPMISGNAEGSGLGLAISQNIITQHQGLIECKSKPGNTNFIILLPLEDTND